MRLFLIISLCFGGQFTFAQSIVTGKIINTANNMAVEGVNISVDNSEIGTTTNAEGFFRLSIPLFPVRLRCTHIAYEDYELELNSLHSSPFIIYIVPKTSMLEEVVVTAEQIPIPLSDTEQYSLLDFEIVANHILRLEYHGTFQDRVLSLTDLDGVALANLPLQKMPSIKELYKSCIDVIYALSKYEAYPIAITGRQIHIETPIPMDTFQAFIRPCKVRNAAELYFIYEDLNGLRRTISSYNVQTTEKRQLRQISNKQVIENYKRDNQLIQKGQRIGNITTNDIGENRRIRNLQEESDFLSQVFYKPEFPVYLFEKKGRILLFNHPEKKLEIYHQQKLQHTVSLDYVEDKTWLKALLYDEPKQNIYGLFSTKNGTRIKSIDVLTGFAVSVGELEVDNYQIEKAIIHNKQIYYLKSERLNGQNRGLLKLKLLIP